MQTAVNTIVEITIYSTIMILITLGIKALFSNKIDVRIISFIWLIILFRLLFPVYFDSPINLGVVDRLFAEKSLNEENVHGSTLGNADGDINLNTTITNPAIAEPNNVATVSEPDIDQKAKINIVQLAAFIWLLGAITLLAKRIYRIILFRKKVKDIHPVNSNIMNKLREAKNIVRISKNIDIAESYYVDIPMVYGITRPVILLPIGFAQSICDRKLIFILVHELCHVKRRDVLKNYLWLIARTLYWFNPIVQIAYKSYVEDIEESCDQMVLGLLNEEDICDYSQSLLDVTRLMKKSTNLPIAVSFCNNTTAIRKRVMNMIKPQKKSKTAKLITILITGIMIFACFTTACQKEDTSAPETSASDTSLVLPSEDMNTEGAEDGKAAVEKLSYLMSSEIESIELTQTEDFFGDKIEFYTCSNLSSFQILASDNSLVSFVSKEVDLSITMQLSDDELKEIAIEHVKKIWGYDDVSITYHETELNELSATETSYSYCVEGLMGKDDRLVEVVLNGNGELYAIISYPQNVDYNKGVSVDDAMQKAVELIKEEVEFAEDDNITLISPEVLIEAAYAPIYIFKYEYRTENPTTDHFDFDAEVKIQMATGELGGIGITPVTSNVDVFSIEEAEPMAIEHIAENTEDKDVSKYKTVKAWSSTIDGESMYTFIFEYDSKYRYSLMMTAGGEFWDIAGGN